MSDSFYCESLALREKLEVMRLTDLLALNPTLQDMRHVLAIMIGSHSGEAREWDVAEVRNLLKDKTPRVRLQHIMKANAGKFRVILMIDSEKYQLGEDQNTIGCATHLFKEHGKAHPCCVYNDKGKVEVQLA